jgi:hypothetical protein
MGNGMKTKSESGIALISALLVLVLLGALLVAFVVSVNSDQSLISVDRDQNRAYYAAQAGLEKLTADLGTLFDTNYAPTPAQVNALMANPPVLTGISFVSPGGGSGYQIVVTDQGQKTIPAGPYSGLVGVITQYTMTSTAHTLKGGEVKMQRKLQTVAVPVFQFGIFSDTDLSFFAGPNFNFGGRVNTNGNLFLAEGDGSTLTLSDKVTAVGEVIRKKLSNGWATSSYYTGTVRVSKAPGSYRNLASNEGSLVDSLGSAQNEPTWTNLSIGTYNGRIRNGRTGATALNLPLVSQGATPIDIIRRPAQNSNEDTANPDVFRQRYFAMASLRILISDTAADITSLPTVTAGAPVRLVGNAPDAQGTFFAAAGAAGGDYRSNPGTPLIDGYIKIDMQDQGGAWHDVTNEILGLGITGKDWTGTCANPNPNPNADSIIRFQRFRDNPGNCNNAPDGAKYWPNVLYDTREGDLRDNNNINNATIYLGGVMHYVELDINNLCRWFTGAIGVSGTQAINTTGYVVYFSDRRTNRNAAGQETAEYGFEDFVNPLDANGTPNGLLDDGEDVNNKDGLDTYGETPQLPPCTGACVAAPLDSNATPWTSAGVTAAIARANKPLFFRRALKVVNGATISLGVNNGVNIGLAVASENPLYVQGDYNAPGGAFNPNPTGPGCSLIADAVTLLSNQWNDVTSFTWPQKPSGRDVTQDAYYRAAIISGKGRSFPQPNGTGKDFGTDGGIHNFFRLLENWDGQTLNYRGSVVSLFYNRQAVGTYKCCTNVYSPPGRGYNFDTDFLNINLLPPRTPMFRDVNITGFTRLLMANQ